MIKDNSNDLSAIIEEAEKKHFDEKELKVLKTVYDLSMVEFVNKKPYSVYRENRFYDKEYFEEQKIYSASKTRKTIVEIIDSWHKPRGV